MGRPDENIGVVSQDLEARQNTSQEELIVKPLKSWKGYIWDTWELPKDQRWLMFKLDAFVLTFASVSR
jgi:ACS family pantothenate transporter-like MFS transporter